MRRDRARTARWWRMPASCRVRGRAAIGRVFPGARRRRTRGRRAGPDSMKLNLQFAARSNAKLPNAYPYFSLMNKQLFLWAIMAGLERPGGFAGAERRRPGCRASARQAAVCCERAAMETSFGHADALTRRAGRVGQGPDRALPCAMPGYRRASHGFKSGTPVASKSATLRIATVMPGTSAVAAINASRSALGSGTTSA